MDCVLASNNAHKIDEIRRILQPLGISVLSLAQAGIVADPEETGQTFAQNAMLKAKAVEALCRRAVIADDSGLMVDALGGEPGIYSARFAGEEATDAQNNQKLLRLMQNVPTQERTARFVCAISLLLPGGAHLDAYGTCEGQIGLAPSGENGFGYDPLFYVGDVSFAQLPSADKDKISHRANALKSFVAELPEFLARNKNQI